MRHRLLVTWVFVGVVPIVLICFLLVETSYVLMGQIVSYMTTTEVERESDSLRNAAYTLAWSVEHRATVSAQALAEAFVKERSEVTHSQAGVILKAGTDQVSIPAGDGIAEIPGWANPDSAGLIKDAEKNRSYFAAHVVRGAGKDAVEVFLYQVPPPAFFAGLLPGVATVLAVEGTADASGVVIETTGKAHSGFSVRKEVKNPDPTPIPPPPGRGWWDHQVTWIVLMPTTDLKTGSTDDPSLALVSSRPSLIVRKLFSTLGGPAVIVIFVMIFTAVILLLVEIVSALLGLKLSRSITRAIADLYEGTRKVQSGNLSHRIPIRKTRDQLSELSGSFNAMTERVEELIREVKEKERLENELEIARQVQLQLFPREFPQLKTLQLLGSCEPARTVSGDYYDFISVQPAGAALAIGDISGKGISAALLMAHIQSALRSQLEDRAAPSPAVILSVLSNHLYKSSPPEKYATFFLGLYSDEASQLVYTNAGHLAPMIVRRDEIVRLPGEGFPIGLFPGVSYDQQLFTLEPGDVVAAFTDGITETPNRDGEEFGDQRLMELLLRYSRESLDRIASEISTAVGSWAGNTERHDDTTIILARRLP